jgi:hypothetical protein
MSEESSDDYPSTRREAQDILSAARANIEDRNRPLPSEQESEMNQRIGVDRVSAAEIVAGEFDAELRVLDVFLSVEGEIRLRSLLQQRAEALPSNLGDNLEELIDTAVRTVKAAITGEVRQALMEVCSQFNNDLARLYNDLKNPSPSNAPGKILSRIDNNPSVVATQITTKAAVACLSFA